MKIKIKKIHPESVIPTYSKEGDAGLDLTAIEKKECKVTNTINYRTGISIAIPQGYYGQIQPRSSVYTTGLTLVNSPAIIDSGYGSGYGYGYGSGDGEGYRYPKFFI